MRRTYLRVCQLMERLTLPSMIRLMALFAFTVALNGCAMKSAVRTNVEPSPPAPPQLEEYTHLKEFSLAKGDDIIGALKFIRLEKGDTLPDIARHFGLGLTGVSAANPGVDLWTPEPGVRILLPGRFILPDAPRKGIVINLATMRLFKFNGDGQALAVLTYPVGVGTEERPSPMGKMRVDRKVSRPTWHVPASIARDHLKKGDPLPAKVPPGPKNPLGEFALYLSAPTYLIHGTNKPASIGLKATNGCIRLYPEDIKDLYKSTPAKTPVNIVDQPYLLGQANGVVYLEVHGSQENLDSVELDKIYKKMKNIEKAEGRSLDWQKVKQALAEARGIPVPIFTIRQGGGKDSAEPMEVKHPATLNGRPEIPKLTADAWAVLAAELRDPTDAVRLAAIINHQGPHIPARVSAKGAVYQVIAGPFADVTAAKDALRQLKVDLEIDGSLIAPVRKK